MSVKVIFLNIDGVLNTPASTSRCSIPEEKREIIGIDSSKLKKLKKIIADTGAIIVLTSSWKYGWERFKKDKQKSQANYMDRKFDKYGLRIYDKTPDSDSKGIKEWLQNNFDKDEKVNWIVIDDEINDFDNDIISHVVFTKATKGLEKVDLAIELLNEGDE